MEFRILGPLEVEASGRLLPVTGAKQRGLLALLLIHANEVVPRERLIDELWGARPPQTAATALQVHVSQLRKVLGRDVIVTQRPGYLIRVADGELDLHSFHRAVADARTVSPVAVTTVKVSTLSHDSPSWRPSQPMPPPSVSPPTPVCEMLPAVVARPNA